MEIAEEIRVNPEKGALRLFAECRAALYAEAVKLCPTPEDAEDLTMRAFERALAKIDSYDSEKGRLIDWMKAILRNLRKNDLELKAANAVVATDPGVLADELAPADNATEEELFRKSDGEYLRRAIDTLPSELREAVVLHYLMDLPIADMAKVLKVPVGTVKARLHYARKALQGKLVEEMKKPRVLITLALFFLTAVGYAAYTTGVLDRFLGTEEKSKVGTMMQIR